MDEEERQRRMLVAMEYVLAGLAVVIALLGGCVYLLWRILDELQV